MNYQNPGVYIREVPSGARPIEVAGTSTAALLGYAKTGPALEPTAVESFEAYIDKFGAISETGTDKADPMGLAVRAFFQNGGRRAYVVNVSSEGTAASGSLAMERIAEPVTLYTVEATSKGKHAAGLEVWLTPRKGGSPGRFDLRVIRRGGTELEEIEVYKDVTLAPSLDEDVAQTLRTARSVVELTPDPGLAALVYPAIRIDFANASNLKEWKVMLEGFPSPAEGWPLVNFSGMQTYAGDARVAQCRSRLNEALRSRDIAATFACEAAENGDSVKCLLQTTRVAASIRLEDPDDPFTSIAAEKTRAVLIAELLGWVTLEDDNQAVLSGDNSGLDARQLNLSDLSLHFGEFGRTMTLSGFSAQTTLEDVANRIEQELKSPLPMYKPHLPQAGFSDNNITLHFGESKLPGSRVEGWTELDGVWSLAFPTEDARPSFSFQIKATGADAEFTVTVAADLTGATTAEEAVPMVQAAINALAYVGLDAVHVEVNGSRLLIWDGSYDVEVLESDAARILRLNTRNAVSDKLSALQPQLHIVAVLSNGRDGDPGDRAAYMHALRSLEVRTDVGIVLLPGKYWDRSSDGGNWPVIEDAIRHAEQQHDRMVIVDPPPTDTDGAEWNDGADVQDANLSTNSHCAVYYPWVEVPAPGGKNVLVAPSAFAAGVWSRTDESRGVWKAPAGVDASLTGVAKLRHDVTDAVSGALNREGVNCLRNVSGYGYLVWGGRTRAVRREPEWKYLSVRRLALMIEDSLRDSMSWAVHQPNRSELWSALRLNIEAFLSRLHRAGAFQPDAASDAYFVKCSLGTTMTQADIDAGLVRVRVGIAPVKPAEFVEITIEQITQN